jgi:hypothetical protein
MVKLQGLEPAKARRQAHQIWHETCQRITLEPSFSEEEDEAAALYSQLEQANNKEQLHTKKEDTALYLQLKIFQVTQTISDVLALTAGKRTLN